MSAPLRKDLQLFLQALDALLQELLLLLCTSVAYETEPGSQACTRSSSQAILLVCDTF